MVNNNSKLYGEEGELQAERHLVKKGYKILERNWRYRKFEVDIIASIDETIVFVEVKTRKNDTFGDPESFVSRRQQGFLISAANFYLIDRNIDMESRFDVISISDLGDDETLKHIEGAFFPTAR